jgi:HEAT repeat protein
VEGQLKTLPINTLVIALLACALFLSQQPENPAATTQSTQQEQGQKTQQEQEQKEKTQTPPSSTAPENQTSTQPAKPLKEQAWDVLQTGATAEKKEDRAGAVQALGLITQNPRARKLAESALKDDTPEVRAAAAAALGEMQSRRSVAALKMATDDKDPGVALAAAHSLLQLKDDSGYAVYYEILTGERKTGKGLLAQAAAYTDPKKMAEIGFQEALGFIPFGGLGWRAFKMVKKGDNSPARAAAATVLAKDPDPNTTEALTNAVGDKNWIIRAAGLEALASRGNPSVLNTVELYLTDEEGEVKYTAAATALRLIAIKESRQRKKPKK